MLKKILAKHDNYILRTKRNKSCQNNHASNNKNYWRKKRKKKNY